MSKYINANVLKERLIQNITLTNAIDKSFSEAPSIDIEPKRGEWIDKGSYAICSNCRAHSEAQYDGVPVPLKTRYCPNCGARMKGADDE